MADLHFIAAEAGLLLVLILASAFFSASETALFSLGRARLLQYADNPLPERRRVAALMRSYNRTLIALVGGNMFVNTGLSVVSAELLGSFRLSPTQATIISVVLTVVVLLMFGEITPKAVSMQYAERLSLWISAPVWWLRTLLTPLIWTVEQVSARILDLLGRRRSPPLRPEEYGEYLEMAYSIGAFNDMEAELLKHIFMLRRLRINRIMTPRIDIPCVRSDLSAAALAKFIRHHRRHFYPVIRKTLDDANAVLSVRDFFALDPAKREAWSTSEAIVAAIFIPENASLTRALETLKGLPAPVALVTDEYGGLVGMIERDRIFEEIVGETEGEYNRSPWQVRRENQTTWRINGQISLDALRELLPWLSLPSTAEAHTLNGWFAVQLGRIPQQGDRFSLGDMDLVAFTVDHNRVVEAELRWLGGPMSSEEGNVS